MEELLKYLESFVILNNSVMDWSLAAIGTVVLFLALRVMFRVLERRLGSLSKKTSNVLDDIIAAALESTRTWSLFFAAVWGGARFLDLGKADSYVDFTLLIVLTLQVALWANRMVTAYIIFYTDAKKADNPGAVSAIQGMSFIVRLVIWSVALLLAVSYTHLTLPTILLV